MEDKKAFIAARVAKELKDGDIVNLGIGLPTLVPRYLDPSVHLILQSENGFLGLTSGETPEDYKGYLVNASGRPASIAKDGAFFNSADSFTIIRGGHVDATVLGALQVDQGRKYCQLDHTGQDGFRYGRRNGFGCRRQKSYRCYGTYKQG